MALRPVHGPSPDLETRSAGRQPIQRGGAELAADCLLRRGECGVRRAVAVDAAWTAPQDTRHPPAIALDGLDDREQVDRGSGAGEPVAAAPTCLNLGETRVDKIAHHRRENR